MTLERAELPVVRGQEAAFEEAFARARKIIASAAGCRSVTLSEAYGQWRALLHHVYDPFPVVEHFRQVNTR